MQVNSIFSGVNNMPTRLTAPTKVKQALLLPLNRNQVTLVDPKKVQSSTAWSIANWASPTKPFTSGGWMQTAGWAQPRQTCSSLTSLESCRQNTGVASAWEWGENNKAVQGRQKCTLIRPPAYTLPHQLNDLQVHKAGVCENSCPSLKVR